MAKVKIPGFPTEVSSYIELPDIGELLMYPVFQGIEADDFMKYATDFQRYLFSKIPLRNDRKYVTIRSSVHLLEPNTRSHVGAAGVGPGWHIDGITDYDFREPSERVFILCSPCQAVTEFNLNPLEVEAYDNDTRDGFCERINRNPKTYGVVGKPIEPCRIYTFENHMHRAVEPTRIEFRYFLRVRETNGTDVFTNEPLKDVVIAESKTGHRYKQIQYGESGVTIAYPKTLK